MTSIRAPWRVRVPRDGRDGFDAPPAIDGLPGKDGKDGRDGENGKSGARGLSIVRAPAAEIPTLPWRAEFERDDVSHLATRMMVGPIGGAAKYEVIPFRDDFDAIVYADILPISD